MLPRLQRKEKNPLSEGSVDLSVLDDGIDYDNENVSPQCSVQCCMRLMCFAGSIDAAYGK